MKPLGTIQLSLGDPALQSGCPLPLPAVQNFITKFHGAQGGGSPTPQGFSGSPDFCQVSLQKGLDVDLVGPWVL